MTQRPPSPSTALILSSILVLTLTACSGSTVKEDVAPIEDLNLLDESGKDAVVTGTLDEDGNIRSEVVDGESLQVEGESLSGDDSESGAIASPAMTIYFNYDSVLIESQYVEVVDRVAEQLNNKSSLRIRLEGHADERGTRTYNLALGEQRAQSVVDMLLERGVLAEQMNWVSYGEEIPAMVGQGESAWAKNRRVEIIVEE